MAYPGQFSGLKLLKRMGALAKHHESWVLSD
jgi:hypothetical protein